jgi:rSAM/selenodomain-associated transferase 1
MGINHNNRHVVVVCAKAPIRGTVKTRIAVEAGDDRALIIYERLMRLTGRMLDTLHFHVAFTGSNDPRTLMPFFPRAVSFFRQRGHSLGRRLKNAVLHCATLGYGRVCLIGCDCPTLAADQISKAFELLRLDSDVAIGPAVDGGYYLIAGSVALLGLFDVDGWGGPNLLTQTCDAAARLRLRCHLLEKKSDIDTYDDFLKWKTGR